MVVGQSPAKQNPALRTQRRKYATEGCGVEGSVGGGGGRGDGKEFKAVRLPIAVVPIYLYKGSAG